MVAKALPKSHIARAAVEPLVVAATKLPTETTNAVWYCECAAEYGQCMKIAGLASCIVNV
jgi:hypothetical protein